MEGVLFLRELFHKLFGLSYFLVSLEHLGMLPLHLDVLLNVSVVWFATTGTILGDEYPICARVALSCCEVLLLLW